MPLRPARPVRPGAVLKRFGVARQLGMDDERDRGQVEAARGDVGRDADARALVAQRLQRVVALALAVLARQRDRGEAALGQAGVQAADGVARGAEQDRRLRLVEAQQVDDRMLDLGRRHGHGLVVDVADGLASSPTVAMRSASFW